MYSLLTDTNVKTPIICNKDNATCACPAGKTAVTTKQPSSNGCGPEWANKFGFNAVVADIVPGKYQPCCDTHDICYGLPNVSKRGCDNTFRECLINKADGIVEHITAKLMYEAVDKFGNSSFTAGQDESISCQ